jgi:hypothetical protein
MLGAAQGEALRVSGVDVGSSVVALLIAMA